MMSDMDLPQWSRDTGQQIADEFTPVAVIRGEDDLDTHLLREMSEEAQRFILRFTWCDAVLESYFAGGVGGIFAIFFFRIDPERPDVDRWIWIIVGDIPPAYLPLADCKSPAEAFNAYMRGMSRWVELARMGQVGTAEQGVPAVDVPATPEWADRISQKLNGLNLAVKPFFERTSDPSIN